MKTLEYIGKSDVRSIAPGDCDGACRTDVTWDGGNHKTAEVTNEVADYLLNNEQGQWRDVDAPVAATDDDTDKTGSKKK